MQVKPLSVFESLRGKVCQHSDMYVRQNRKTGKLTTGKLCYPSDKPATADQLAAQQAFKTLRQQAVAIVSDPTKWSTYASAFDAQSKYATKVGFIMHRIATGDIVVE